MKSMLRCRASSGLVLQPRLIFLNFFLFRDRLTFLFFLLAFKELFSSLQGSFEKIVQSWEKHRYNQLPLQITRNGRKRRKIIPEDKTCAKLFDLS